MAPLPAERVHIAPPFTNIGLDFTGPLKSVQSVDSKNEDNEDRPKRRGSEEKLANEGVSWKFTTERASHRGGHWERVCRQLKEPLRKVLGKAFLNYTEKMTVLTDIEALINSRPLTYIGDDIRDGRVVTPALLVIGRDLQSPPDNLPKKAEVSLSEQYLPSLTVRQKWTKEEIPLKERDIVLVSEDNVSRGKWKLGKVAETFPGKDGKVRTVKVLTEKGMINRPVQRLHLLEAHRDSVFSERNSSVTTPIGREENNDDVRNDVRPPADVQRDVNDRPSLVGEDVQARSRYGRPIGPLKRL
ncbi:hypothetical protein ACROYT_G029432 [Oculina patagonica]